MHAPHARQKRRKGADDGEEARQEDGYGAVFVEHGLRLVDAFGGERLDAPGIYDGLPHLAAYPVVRRVAEHSCQAHEDDEHEDVEPAAVRREDARAEQQAVARQKRRDHQARLHEDDDEQRRVHPHRPERDDPLRYEPAWVAQ